MNEIARAILKTEEYAALSSAIEKGRTPVLVGGTPTISRAHFSAALRGQTQRPVVVITSDESSAIRCAADLEFLCGEDVPVVCGRDLSFYDTAVVSREWEQARISALYSIATHPNRIAVLTVDAALLRTIPKRTLLGSAFCVRSGDEYNVDELTDRLVRCGYRRSQIVEGTGQFALRGGILDFFSPQNKYPVRVEFFGDEVDSMGSFDPDTQRRIENITSAEILPICESVIGLCENGADGLCEKLLSYKKNARRRKNGDELCAIIDADIEKILAGTMFSADKLMGLIYDEFATAFDYIPEDAIVVFEDYPHIVERAKGFVWQMTEDIRTAVEAGRAVGFGMELCRNLPELMAINKNAVYFDSFIGGSYDPEPKQIVSLSVKQLPNYSGSLDVACDDIAHFLENGYTCVVLTGNNHRADLMKETLSLREIPAAVDYHLSDIPKEGVVISVGTLSNGFEYPSMKFAVISEAQLSTHRTEKKSSKRKKALIRISDLTVGDLVVHEHHGIAKFAGMHKMPVDGVEKDYLKLVFAGTDALYLPVTQMNLISKYIGAAEDAPVKLNKLGGTEWAKAKSRARGAAKDLAEYLIGLYSKRMARQGIAFPPDDDWQRAFEDGFDYAETEDQLRCSAEIKADMERPVPMDRLLCGDVGFGKTEVAFRAIMKCILGGKQAAILVPTTVLARQHYMTATRRFSNFPVRIGILSRFSTPAQKKETIKKVHSGEIDLLIGTHSLLQKSVQFKALGLLIVDEEQRFGVSHKERLKEMSTDVDVLTLSATPIPRTLNMALSGIRDMSLIEEAPRDRYPVQTYVLEYSTPVILDAIRRELARGGQVFYLYNRVETIDIAAQKLAAALPDAVIAVAHGQMPEEALSSVMQRMTDGDVNVLVCSTIIETGLDMPNVNTLIINDADHLGLSQLHQLRGRVGRSTRHAYAYLTYRRGKVLSEVATKRLSAIREFAEFGSGFQIAMRDLEIRGAGNVLGSQQSGHMMSVGYDMYLKLLEEAVAEQKGEEAELPTECAVDLLISANIPESYVSSSPERMDLYRRMAIIEDEEDSEDMIDELIDRYGDPPPQTMALVSIALLRAKASAAGISELTQRGQSVTVRFSHPNLETMSRICGEKSLRGRILLNAGETPYLSYRLKNQEDVMSALKEFIAVIS